MTGLEYAIARAFAQASAAPDAAQPGAEARLIDHLAPVVEAIEETEAHPPARIWSRAELGYVTTGGGHE